MKINELSKQTGINLETIHYYEKIGVLPEPKRQANGYRFYDENSLQLLHFIKTCRSLGFSIEDIKQLNQIKRSPNQHGVADQLIAQQLENVVQKIEQLKEIQVFLQGLETMLNIAPRSAV